MGQQEGLSSRSVVLTDYWAGKDRPYRSLLRDPKTDQGVDLHDLLSNLVKEAGAVDGELVQVSVRRIEGVVPFDERRVRLVEDHTYRRETAEEAGPVTLALRKAARKAGRIDRPYVLDESVVEPHQVPEDWTERIVLLWEEDEVLRHDPDAEHLPGALVRFGGPGFDLGVCLAKHDDGDSGYDLYPNGWVRGWSYCGDSLWRLVKEK